MKKVISLCIVIITLACAVTGCATFSDKSKEIKKGMTKNEVLKIMGKPKYVQKNDYGDEAWQYYDLGFYYDTFTVIWFYQENVSGVTQDEASSFNQIDLSNSPRSLEEKKLAEEQARAERAEQEQARAQQRAERDQAKKAEQTRLAELYRQAGNNLGNMRNTSWRFSQRLNNRHTWNERIDFGDGNFNRQSPDFFGNAVTETGTYRVSGDTVIFLLKEEYSTGTIVGNSLTTNGGVMGNEVTFNRIQ